MVYLLNRLLICVLLISLAAAAPLEPNQDLQQHAPLQRRNNPLRQWLARIRNRIEADRGKSDAEIVDRLTSFGEASEFDRLTEMIPELKQAYAACLEGNVSGSCALNGFGTSEQTHRRIS